MEMLHLGVKTEITGHFSFLFSRRDQSVHLPSPNDVPQIEGTPLVLFAPAVFMKLEITRKIRGLPRAAGAYEPFLQMRTLHGSPHMRGRDLGRLTDTCFGRDFSQITSGHLSCFDPQKTFPNKGVTGIPLLHLRPDGNKSVHAIFIFSLISLTGIWGSRHNHRCGKTPTSDLRTAT